MVGSASGVNGLTCCTDAINYNTCMIVGTYNWREIERTTESVSGLSVTSQCQPKCQLSVSPLNVSPSAISKCYP